MDRVMPAVDMTTARTNEAQCLTMKLPIDVFGP
jgi:hypothetical protein